MSKTEPDWFSKHFSDALNGDRAEGLRFWEELASGKLDGEAREWIVAVAKGVLEADKAATGTPRLQGIVDAVCLGGRERPHIELREHLARLLGLEDFQDLTTGESLRVQDSELIAAARKLDRYKDWKEKRLRDLIHVLRKKV